MGIIQAPPSKTSCNHCPPKIVEKQTGRVTVDPSIKWEWQSNDDPWKSDEQPKWAAYSKEHIEILERALRENHPRADIGDYFVDFEAYCQCHQVDQWRVRPIRRVDLNKRVQRFCSELSTSETFNQAPYCHNPPLVEKWLNNRRFNFKVDSKGYDITDEENLKGLKEVAQLAVEGIEEEAKKNNWNDFLQTTVKRLQFLVKTNLQFIFRRLILVYTIDNIKEGESFYHVVNKALRENDFSKTETLGPFCYLLNLALKAMSQEKDPEYSYSGTVYRGLTLEEGLLELYKKAWRRGLHISIPSFVATTKSKELADLFLSKENFGGKKVLLLIEHAQGTYIESLTAHRGEEEVMLPAGSSYKVLEVKEEEIITIRLEMINTNLESHSETEPISLTCHSLNSLSNVFDQNITAKLNFDIDVDGVNITPQSKVQALEDYVVLAAEGIELFLLEEGDEKKTEGKEIAKELREMIRKTPENIFKLIVREMIQHKFLCDQINKFLKTGDISKMRDLSPIIYLLLSYFEAIKKELEGDYSTKKSDFAHVYRGVNLDKADIELYKELFNKKLHFVYNAFLSASKNKEIGDTKVLIDIEIPRESLSSYGALNGDLKEQILLPPNLNFEVLGVKDEGEVVNISLKYIDYLL